MTTCRSSKKCSKNNGNTQNNGKNDIRNICMLNVHGYFDAMPVLGRTDTGGQIVYVLELAKHLAKRNINVDIYTRRFGNRSGLEYVTPDVRIIRIPCGARLFVPKELLYEYLLEFIDNMAEYIKAKGLAYQVVHSHYWDAGFVAMKLAERLATGFIHTSHSLGALKKEQMMNRASRDTLTLGDLEQKYRFELRVDKEREVFNAARQIIATTAIEKEHYIRYYGVDASKIVVIPPGIDMEWYRVRDKARAKAALKFTPAKHTIFTLGRIDARKGLDLLLRAASEVVKAEKNVMIVIGGGSKRPGEAEKNERRKLKRLVRELGLSGKVVFTGYLLDGAVPWYYCAADLFVVPSRYEPFGLTILEAMATATPVLATKFGGPVHIIRDGKDGFLIDPEDTRAFADTMLRVLRDDKLRQRVVENASKTVRERYCWDAVVDEYLACVAGRAG